jgi:hypothetical protein
MRTRQRRNTVPLCALMLWLLSLGYAFAQPAPPPGPGDLPTGRPTSTVEGTVVQYLMNHHGDVDGLLLNDGSQVHLPPHMAKDLVALVKPADSVSVQGYRSVGGLVIEAPVITNTKTGQSLVEREPTLLDRPMVPPSVKDMFLAERHAEGIVRNLLYGPRGDLNGVVLEDRTIVRVPPHAAYQVANLLQLGRSISAIGYGTENEYGRVIEATAIGSSGTAMMPISDPGPAPFRR